MVGDLVDRILAGSNTIRAAPLWWTTHRASWESMPNGQYPIALVASYCIMRAASKAMPPILLCWPATSEVDIGGVAVEVESSHQYLVPFCCCMMDGSRGAVWLNGVWHGSGCEAKVCHWIPLWVKMAPTDIHWHLLNIDGDQAVDVSAVRWRVARFSSGDSGSSLLVQVFMSMACRSFFTAGKNA